MGLSERLCIYVYVPVCVNFAYLYISMYVVIISNKGNTETEYEYKYSLILNKIFVKEVTILWYDVGVAWCFLERMESVCL